MFRSSSDVVRASHVEVKDDDDDDDGVYSDDHEREVDKESQLRQQQDNNNNTYHHRRGSSPCQLPSSSFQSISFLVISATRNKQYSKASHEKGKKSAGTTDTDFPGF